MSVQFGMWNLEGRSLSSSLLEKADLLLSPYGPDGRNCYLLQGLSILYRPFHTDRQAKAETQPHVTKSGAILTWDGRLDNRQELIRQANAGLDPESADAAIVAAAFDLWGPRSFPLLIGDWALSVFHPQHRSLVLAKDVMGTRHLFYCLVAEEIRWSSVLDPLVLFRDRSLNLNKEYIAGWLGGFPAAHLTPYVDIKAVPPGSYVVLGDEKPSIHRYWSFNSAKRTHYRHDEQYEEHFRSLFRQAVQRRLRADRPILAELSGGMDSSSIVCMADTVIETANVDIPRLETVSYYNDSEPNWNERPYFTKVEEQRGAVGCHIDVSSHPLCFDYKDCSLAVTPLSHGQCAESSKQFAQSVRPQGYRVLLSGLGGDEVLGGVPTPVPELADLFASAQLFDFVRALTRWGLATQKPLFHLVGDVVREFLPGSVFSGVSRRRPIEWLASSFRDHNRAPIEGYRTRFRLTGPRPSFQAALTTIDVLRRQLACSPFPTEPACEKRYPYLDRDLLEFLFSIPREQLVRPQQRRSLMRRALRGIVPNVILDRRRKAFVVRSGMVRVSSEWMTLLRLTCDMELHRLGMVNPQLFLDQLNKARRGGEIDLVSVSRTLLIEYWLRHLRDKGFPALPKSAVPLESQKEQLSLRTEAIW